ncbi:MAG TPA: hypothetical protein VFY14_16270, partial [Streptomyces sp.]|nr:hypothetical protein [Streptomyces sp.]
MRASTSRTGRLVAASTAAVALLITGAGTAAAVTGPATTSSSGYGHHDCRRGHDRGHYRDHDRG